MEHQKCTYENHKSKPAKVWHFLAHEDSWASFAVDAVLVVLIGKFLFLPGLGLAFGTDYPLVAVVSSSMDHQGKGLEQWWFENGKWYESHGIAMQQFKEFYKPNGFLKGDAFVVMGVDFNNVKVGDVIVYRVPSYPEPIIHRVVAVNEDRTLQTKGDANYDQIPFEKSVLPEQVEGKTVLWGPKLGWVKVIFVEIFKFFMR